MYYSINVRWIFEYVEIPERCTRWTLVSVGGEATSVEVEYHSVWDILMLSLETDSVGTLIG